MTHRRVLQEFAPNVVEKVHEGDALCGGARQRNARFGQAL